MEVLASPDSKLVREKTTQTKLNIKEFTELEKELKELNTKYNQLRSETSTILYPEANIPALAILDKHLIAQAQEAIDKLNNLRVEKNQIVNQNQNLQQNITNLQNEITQLDKTLQTTQREKDQLQQSLKRSLIGSLFKDKQKKQRIKELNNSLSFLRGLLVDKNQQLTNLTTQRDNLQNQVNQLTNQINDLTNEKDDYQTKWDGAEEDLRQKQETIRGYLQRIEQLEGEKEQRDNEITDLRNNIVRIEEERDCRPNIALAEWNNDYSQRPTQQQLSNLQNELNNTKNERDNYQRIWNNHTCPTCKLNHCDDYCKCICRNCWEPINGEY